MNIGILIGAIIVFVGYSLLQLLGIVLGVLIDYIQWNMPTAAFRGRNKHRKKLGLPKLKYDPYKY